MILRQVSTDPDHDEQAEDALFYRDALQELVQIGTDLARLVHQNATAQAEAAMRNLTPCAPPTVHAAAFDRIARAVRRTIALARSLYEPLARALARTRAAFCGTTPPGAGQNAAGHPGSAAPGREDAKAPADAPSAGLRDRREAPDRDRPERPDCDAPERDDDRDEDDCDKDDTGRPPAEVIKEICRDLGLDAPPGPDAWTHRTPADTAQPRAQAAAPDSVAASGARQPGFGPQQPDAGSTHHPSASQPSNLAAAHHPGPTPTWAGNGPLNDPAESATSTLCQTTHVRGLWHPPPET